MAVLCERLSSVGLFCQLDAIKLFFTTAAKTNGAEVTVHHQNLVTHAATPSY